MNRGFNIVGVFIVFVLLVAGEALGSSCRGQIEVELRLDEPSILAYGVVVGELVVTNTGDKPCTVHFVLSPMSGNLIYEIESPSGNMIKIGGSNPLWCPPPSRVTEFAPGDYVRHPVCLLKLDDDYLFVEEGIYRLRATLRATPEPRPVPPRDSVESRSDFEARELAPRPEWNSGWLEIVVRPVGRGRPNYVNSHPWRDVVGAFRCPNGLNSIQAQLPTFFEYQHEQEKLLVYQFDRHVFYGLRVEQVHNDEIVQSAKEMLSLAKKAQVGILMWKWIVEQLEKLPREVEARRKFNVKNGYIF